MYNSQYNTQQQCILTEIKRDWN